MKQNENWSELPMERLAELLGSRGAAAIELLLLLSAGAMRFGELRERMKSLSQKTLVADLRALERAGVVNRMVFAEIPPRVEYSLSDAGEKLMPTLRSLQKWCSEYLADQEET